MTTPTKIVVDCSTGAVEEIELTQEEIAQLEADAVKVESDRVALEAENAAKAAQKAELLAKLGINEDEAKLLLL
jgi:hypothetical protein